MREVGTWGSTTSELDVDAEGATATGGGGAVGAGAAALSVTAGPSVGENGGTIRAE